MSKLIRSKGGIVFEIVVLIFFLTSLARFSEAETGTPGGKLLMLDAEILEVEELKEPLGNAIYTVKDLSSGLTLRLYADRHRSLIQMGDAVIAAADVLGGGKATIIYRQTGDGELPEVIFARVSNIYYT